MGKFQGICPRVAPRASEHRRFKLMSRCESINLSTKPYFVGQKAFSVAAKDGKRKKKKKTVPHFSIEQQNEASSESEKRKLLPLPWRGKESTE